MDQFPGYILSYKDANNVLSGAILRVINVGLLECVTPATVRLLAQTCGGVVLLNSCVGRDEESARLMFGKWNIALAVVRFFGRMPWRHGRSVFSRGLHVMVVVVQCCVAKIFGYRYCNDL